MVSIISILYITWDNVPATGSTTWQEWSETFSHRDCQNIKSRKCTLIIKSYDQVNQSILKLQCSTIYPACLLLRCLPLHILEWWYWGVLLCPDGKPYRKSAAWWVLWLISQHVRLCHHCFYIRNTSGILFHRTSFPVSFGEKPHEKTLWSSGKKC